MNRLYNWLGNAIRGIYDLRLSGPSILDLDRLFPAGHEFQAAWPALAAEAAQIAKGIERVPRFHEIMPAQEEISANDNRDWRVFIAKAYGVGVEPNLARCPTLAALIRKHPEVLSASFSYLAPGKFIPEHRGPFRGVLRFHLGLSVPLNAAGEAAAVLSVDGIPRPLKDGECLLWDDTYPHSVLNASAGVRTALLLDVKRPGMPWDMRALSAVLVRLVGLSVRMNAERGIPG